MKTIPENIKEENLEEVPNSIENLEIPLKKKLRLPLFTLIALLLTIATFLIFADPVSLYNLGQSSKSKQSTESANQNPENEKVQELSNSESLEMSSHLTRVKEKRLVDIYYITSQQYDKIMSNVVDEGERFDNTKIESNDNEWHIWAEEIQSQDLLLKGTTLCKVDFLWCGTLHGDKAISDELERCKQKYNLSNLSEFKGNTGDCCLSLMSGKKERLAV